MSSTNSLSLRRVTFAGKPLGQALRAIGQPGAERVPLPGSFFAGKLAGSMTQRILPWAAAGFLITIIGARSMCIANRDRGPEFTPAARVEVITQAPPKSVALDAPPIAEEPTTIEVHAGPLVADWCEPLERPLCPKLRAACPPTKGGTPRTCRRRTLSDGAVELVCVLDLPDSELRKWRRTRLRRIVDEVCKRSRGCSPRELTAYLSVLAEREASLLNERRHRMDGDTKSASNAWVDNAETYAASPAHVDAWRWSTGLGYFGQNPAFMVKNWDARAEPEILCDEIVSVLVHLRSARKRYGQLSRGVECDGEEFHGTGLGVSEVDTGPSWYDVSLVNSGSEACPAQPGQSKRYRTRTRFVKDTRLKGLDPYAALTPMNLGEPIDVATQETFARDLRAVLDQEHPRP